MQSTTRPALLLFCACLLFHLAGTWSIPLIDRDEPRFAEASREMSERGDFVVPFFNGDYRFDKPPLTYWAQVISYRIFGTNDFAARFPSAVAAAAVAVVLLLWGRRLHAGDRIGCYAAAIFSLSFQVVEHAKAAVADMWLVLFVTLAHWAAFELWRDQLPIVHEIPNNSKPRPCRCWWWLFYVSLALAFLAKGPIGWTPLLTLMVVRFVSGASLRHFAFVRGLSVTLVLVAAWGIPALIRTDGEFFYVGIGRHVVARSFSAIGGHGASSFGLYLLLLPFYFLTVFLTFFPWSLRLPWLVARVWRKRDAIDLYFVAGTLVIFGIFTVVTTRLVHYTLPAFPLMALLMARWLEREGREKFVRRCAFIMAVIYLGCGLFLAPFAATLSPARELFRQAKPDLRPEMQFATVDFAEPSLVWYFRGRVRAFMTSLRPAGISAFMAEPGPRFIILPTAETHEAFPNPPASWKTFSAEGFNVAKGRRANLTLVLKPD